MHIMPRRFLAASVILGSLLSIQANAGEDAKNAPAGNQPAKAAVSAPAAVSKGSAATSAAPNQQNAKAPAQNAAVPVAKPATTENKPAASKPTASTSAAKPAAPAKPIETAAPPAPAQASAAAEVQQSNTASASVSHLAPGTHELRSLSIIEMIISLALASILLLVLLRGNLFKSHH